MLVCATCGQEIKPGASVTFSGMAQSETGKRRIVIDAAGRVGTHHAECYLECEYCHNNFDPTTNPESRFPGKVCRDCEFK
jgi:hypothetical protein